MALAVNTKINTGVCRGVCVHLYIYSHRLVLDLAFFPEYTTSSQPQQEQFKPSGFSACVYDSSSPLRAPNCLSLDSCNVNMGVFSTA